LRTHGDSNAMTDESRTEAPHALRPEALWPILIAVLAAMALTLLRPPEIRLAPFWVLPTIEVVLLGAFILNPPERTARRSGLFRILAICIVGGLAVDALLATVLLISVLIRGGETTNSAAALLLAGAVVWASNVIAFALLYWLLDGGGAAARANDMPAALDLAFPQQLNPEVAPPDWRPRFIDYLYLGLTASTAFSPTDVMPLAPWAKVAMGMQSLISLAVIGLVVARAVNVFT
jgi:uncharacterized membrane protein